MMEYTGILLTTFLMIELSFQQHTPITTLTGSSVRLSCACARSSSLTFTKSTTRPAITWTLTSLSGTRRVADWTDRVFYSSAKKYHMVTKGRLQGDLVIYDTSLADQGNYTCEITKRCTVILNINVPVSKVFVAVNRGPFLKAGAVVMVTENDRALFKCYSFGVKPAANITWSLSGRPIRSGEISSVSFRTYQSTYRYDTVSTLIVRRATILTHHSQQLTCRGSGAGLSMASTSVFLRIIAPLIPPIITGRTNITLSSTPRPIVLTCTTLNSFPLALIQWIVGGKRHSSTSHHQERFGRFDVTSHLELPVDGRHHGLEIACKVSSPLQSLSTTVKLNVLSPPVSMSVNWTENPVREGDSMTVLCTAFGANPVPHVYWKASAYKPNYVTSYEGEATSLLHFSHVARTDVGQYSCLAENQIASFPLAKIFTLSVHYKPTILTRLQTINIPRHSDVINLTCIAEGFPLPLVEWTSPSYIRNISGPIVDVYGTSIVSHLQTRVPHDGRNRLPFTFDITCSANNIIGRTSWTMKIRYGYEIPHKEDDSVNTATTKATLCDDEPPDTSKMPIERPLLIALSSACLVFLIIVIIWHIRHRLKEDKFWIAHRDGFYVDMTRRRAGIPGVSTVDEDAVSNVTSPRLTPSSGASIRFEFVSQQSVENTYDSIPVVNAVPSALQPRRRRIRSADGYFYDVPPPARGTETVRRVQSRKLPTLPTLFLPAQTMQEVLRSLSRDTGERERPTLENQLAGQSETIIREEVQLVKKSKLRRVFSL